jgi:GNAT superfamily N-acetyltransferase
MKLTVREFTDFKDTTIQHKLLTQLSPQVTKKNFDRMLKEMLEQGYRMIGAFDGKKCVGIAGFWIATKFYCGRYLEPDNVVVDKKYRSKGVGKLMLDWLTEEARRNKCKTMILDAYVENFPAHRFYYREGFIGRGIHHLKKL